MFVRDSADLGFFSYFAPNNAHPRKNSLIFLQYSDTIPKILLFPLLSRVN
ncbi:Uncharacterised protein [Vibrio cholerae]|uniref:Uncharacterized protein n=1 Tax=Vibrio cholerae TaxID=666 RepID=A0A656AQ27_VIBCL|nr:Uncharacterised protein [Vibrio cholerae]CSB16339.1 Uncharacterised protein [Vibrio cholerae]CSB48202.1 Uncharacterised protein [Vibrio cholerae]CSC99687.1 Uncharacterised protein [Vibrio cholerae]CSD26291.1 Uncharacterised protein [Vibrio cholerae]